MGQILEFNGIVKHVSEPKVTVKGDNTYTTVTVVLEEQSEQHPSSIAFSCLNKPDEVAKCVIGAEVKAKINIKANEFNGRWFTNLNVWTIEVLQPAPASADKKDEGLPF